MAERPLNPEEAALWRRVVEAVRPAADRAPPALAAAGKPSPRPRPSAPAPTIALAPRKTSNTATLDASWDRELRRGTITPDRSVDLHGDTLERAYGRIDAALANALAAGERVLLLVTGKPGGERAGPQGTRGAIRAVVHDWLAASRHARQIAAVRNAHPRHGGAGALYVVLRRPR